MKDVVVFAFIVGTVVCAVLGYQVCALDNISLKELRRNGYDVIRHAETHGETSTNWIEVIRTDGRPL